MLHLSPEDTASIGVVLGTLKVQAANLGPSSRMADVWRDWVETLSLTYDEQIAGERADLYLAS